MGKDLPLYPLLRTKIENSSVALNLARFASSGGRARENGHAWLPFAPLIKFPHQTFLRSTGEILRLVPLLDFPDPVTS
jgi:hypothetical protein